MSLRLPPARLAFLKHRFQLSAEFKGDGVGVGASIPRRRCFDGFPDRDDGVQRRSRFDSAGSGMVRQVPVADGWNSWFLYGTTSANADYAIRTAAKEGEPQSSPAYGPTTDFRDDIILVNGQFVQWPEGVQR